MRSLPMMVSLRFGVQPAAGSPRNHARYHASLAVFGRCFGRCVATGQVSLFLRAARVGHYHDLKTPACQMLSDDDSTKK